MRYDLAMMAKRLGLRRKETTFAPILVTSAQASSLAQIEHLILAPWYGSREAVMEIYGRELARRVQTDAIDELTSLFARLGDEVSRLILDLTPALQGWAFSVEQWHRGKWARTVLAGTDVDISTMIGPSDAVESIETFIARQTALIRNVSDETRAKVADLVYRGLQQRTPSNQVGRAIAKQLALSRRRANRIAADQSTKLASALDRQRQREAGLDHWKWRHSGKLHYRPEHRARDGNIYTDATAPEDEPGELPFCGCVRQGVLIIDGVAF